MRFPAPLIPGTLIKRYKRFLADVRLDDGKLVTAHCTNTGSMLGCNKPGSPVYLSDQRGKGRKLDYTWELIRVGRTLVGINTLAANRLAREGIESGVVKELQGYERLQAEVPTRPGSRLDFLLHNPEQQCYVEVKNVTLVVGPRRHLPGLRQRARHQASEGVDTVAAAGPPRRAAVRYSARALSRLQTGRRDRPRVRTLAPQGRSRPAWKSLPTAPGSRHGPSP